MTDRSGAHEVARATREQSEATAARVLATATALFAERGYADVGLAEVAARARVTRGAVYHHFRSKIGLFTAVHGHTQRRVGEAVAEAAAGCTDPWRALELGCRAFLTASVRADTRRILLIDAPAVLGWTAWRERDAEHSGRLLAEVLGELHDAGVIEVPSVDATHALLSGAMNEAALWVASAEHRPGAVDEAWQSLRQLLGALRSPAGGQRPGSASANQSTESP